MIENEWADLMSQAPLDAGPAAVAVFLTDRGFTPRHSSWQQVYRAMGYKTEGAFWRAHPPQPAGRAKNDGYTILEIAHITGFSPREITRKRKAYRRQCASKQQTSRR